MVYVTCKTWKRSSFPGHQALAREVAASTKPAAGQGDLGTHPGYPCEPQGLQACGVPGCYQCHV